MKKSIFTFILLLVAFIGINGCGTDANDSLGYYLDIHVTAESDSITVSTAKNGNLYGELERQEAPFYAYIPVTPNDEVWLTVNKSDNVSVKADINNTHDVGYTVHDLGETERYIFNVPTVKY